MPKSKRPPTSSAVTPSIMTLLASEFPPRTKMRADATVLARSGRH